MKWHPSSIGKLMTSPRNKGESLSEGAKTYIRQLAKQDFYGYKVQLDNKFINKGKEQEHESIALLNSVRFKNYKKNDVRVETEYLSGECDIITDDLIIDIKTSWSLETWPATAMEADDYEWQLRAYMLIYNKPFAEVIFCMISTWDQFLNQWDQKSLHEVDHIDPAKRLTSIFYEREIEKEDLMREKLIFASEYYAQYIKELNNK